ncbi:pyrroline-5-carboxylate reductase family protein [Leptolyngbya sp. 7M]|uniref:pyrroline-5-carboxylate reductase family protein n=1 Tax=Leptolyngbya sp. 7M TaxID=2812896 RepID=UPI001B8BEDAF|nr:pyrroline-5-carboxylate reductase dimerization domain-containing protein [Leptolyngbya sp. 7M]QYO63826.1 hypothetical protein JVX88_29025 [Leptolyngbya sp. 7M]
MLVIDVTASVPSFIALSIECECASMMPGVTNLPVASITFAPALTGRFLPIRTIFPSRILISVASSVPRAAVSIVAFLITTTGPTYIFMVMEALTDAGVHLGFSRDVAKELVQETILGSVKFAMESHKHPAELRNMVTSPGGTSAEAIYQMEKGTLRTVLSKAVYSAYKRAVELGKKN